MRRALWLGLAGCWFAGARLAAAAPATTLSAEAGAEADSNVQRVEKGPEIPPAVGAPVLRLGARVTHRKKVAGGTGIVAASALSRIVGDGSIAIENVTFLTADARWVHPLPKRPVAAGFAVTAADAVPLSDPSGNRTFRNLGADGVVVLHAGEQRDKPASLTFALGGRQFTYKPDERFDWAGPTVNVRLDWTLWQAADGLSSLELAGAAGAEARAYGPKAFALASTCNDRQPPSMNCSVGTTILRQDRYQRVGAELTYASERLIGAAGYAVTVIDSNSFGQSLVRHRATLTATTNLPGKLVGTALVTLQFDQFLDGLIVRKDTNAQLFTTIEDENRSSLQLRLARNVTRTWSLESRFAMWRDIGGDPTTTFRRELAYVGAIYVR